MTIPAINTTLKRSTALMENHTNPASTIQKISDPELRPISTALSVLLNN